MQMIYRPLTYYLDGRLYEWTFATATLVLGTAMFIWPMMAKGSILQVLLQVVSGPIAALTFFIVGLLSIVALVANGSSMWIGPRIRSVCAVTRSVLWSQFTLAMFEVSIRQGFPSPMVFFFAIFTLAELYIAYRAVLDVRTGN